MKDLIIAVIVISSFSLLAVTHGQAHMDAKKLNECIYKAMNDESGYEVDEDEATAYCQG